jgi:serine protease Do
VAANLRRAVGLPEVEGLLVRLVEDDSPAARAGLSEGDVIVEANGQKMASPDDLHELLDGSSLDATLELRLVRGVDERRVSVPLAA